MTICDLKECTACGACINTCPKGCISWYKDEYDTLLPQVDDSICVQCNACVRACHNNSKNLQFNTPIKTYAAWSFDKEDRRTSASGGITSVFYQYTIENGGFTAGVELTRERGARFIELKSCEDIQRVKNSKYLYAHMDDIFKKIRLALKDNKFVFFVGLPCHVAALKTYLGKIADSDNLLTADILCHGVVNEDYFFQYLNDIEKRYGKKGDHISFRDPVLGTETFKFTLKSNSESKPFYNQNHYDKNLYYIGYMHELQYRENCYQCHYARTERVSDLTFGDFDGLGKSKPFNHWNRQVSLCLVNTEKGDKYLSAVSDKLFLEERSLEEAVKPQRQLKAPAKGHPNRKLFLENYKVQKNFGKAAKPCLQTELKQNRKNHIISTCYMSVRWLLPVRLLKKILHR